MIQEYCGYLLIGVLSVFITGVCVHAALSVEVHDWEDDGHAED